MRAILRLLGLLSVFFVVVPLWTEDKSDAAFITKLETLKQKKDFSGALKLLNQAIQSDSKNARFLYERGSLQLYSLNNSALAYDDLKKAVVLDPENAYFLFSAGKSAQDLALWKESESWLAKSHDLSARKFIESHDVYWENLAADALGCRIHGVYLQDRYAELPALYDTLYTEFPAGKSWWQAYACVESGFVIAMKNWIDGNFDAADMTLQTAEKRVGLCPLPNTFVKDHELERYREFIGLGKRFQNEQTSLIHNVQSIVVTRTSVDFKPESGPRIRVDNSITDGQIERAKLMQQVLGRTIEALSHGKLRLHFETTTWKGAITDIDEGHFQDELTRTPVYDSIAPSLDDFFSRHSDDTEVFLLFWNGDRVATVAQGGGWNYPYVDWQLYSERRGMIHCPINWDTCGLATVLVHEYFHVMEELSGISPTHGFAPANRTQFPDWKGDGQLDYFEWQFQTTLPKILKGAGSDLPPDWANLSFLGLYPGAPSTEVIAANREAIKRIPAENLQKAAQLAKDAVNLYWNRGQKKDGAAVAERALSFNANQPDAVRISAEQAMEKHEWDKTLNQFQRLLILRPEPWEFATAAYCAQYQLKNLPTALQIIDRYFLLYPKDSRRADMFLNQGRAYYDLKEGEKAIASFRQCREEAAKKEEKAEALCWLAITMGDLQKKKEDGAALLRQAIGEGYDNAFSRGWLKVLEWKP